MGDFEDQIVLSERVGFLDTYALNLAADRGRDDLFHLHRRQDAQRVACLDLGTFVNSNFDHDARHGRSDRSRLGRSLFATGRFDRRVLVLDLDRSKFSVELEQDFSNASFLVDRTRRNVLDDERLALLDHDVEFFADRRLGQEVARRQSPRTFGKLQRSTKLATRKLTKGRRICP